MAFVTTPSRKGSVVARAYELMAEAERAEKKAAKAKPPEQPAPAKKTGTKPKRS